MIVFVMVIVRVVAIVVGLVVAPATVLVIVLVFVFVLVFVPAIGIGNVMVLDMVLPHALCTAGSNTVVPVHVYVVLVIAAFFLSTREQREP